MIKNDHLSVEMTRWIGKSFRLFKKQNPKAGKIRVDFGYKKPPID